MSDNSQLELIRSEAKQPPYKQMVYVKAGQLLAEIEREYLPRLLFEDDEPVKEGDKFERNGIVYEVLSWDARSDGKFIVHCKSLVGIHVLKGERLKRPEPEVLDADGVPIKVGDTVYYLHNQMPLTVTRVGPLEKHKIAAPTDIAVLEEGVLAPIARQSSEVTHRQPDSLERIDEDAKKSPCDYYDNVECDECAAHGKGCHRMMNLDLLRRQRDVLERGR